MCWRMMLKSCNFFHSTCGLLCSVEHRQSIFPGMGAEKKKAKEPKIVLSAEQLKLLRACFTGEERQAIAYQCGVAESTVDAVLNGKSRNRKITGTLLYYQQKKLIRLGFSGAATLVRQHGIDAEWLARQHQTSLE